MPIGAAVIRAAKTPQASAETHERNDARCHSPSAEPSDKTSKAPICQTLCEDMSTSSQTRLAVRKPSSLTSSCVSPATPHLSIALWHQLAVTRRPHRRCSRGHSREPVKFAGREGAWRTQPTCGSWSHWLLNRITSDPMAKSGCRRRAN